MSRACSLDSLSTARVDTAFDEFFSSPELSRARSSEDVDGLLLRVTRREAAEHSMAAEAWDPPAGLSPVRRAVARGLGRDSTCDVMPKLLAAHAADLLSEADEGRLERHLARCVDCRALQARFARAEEAFLARLSERSDLEALLTQASPTAPSPRPTPAAARRSEGSALALRARVTGPPSRSGPPSSADPPRLADPPPNNPPFAGTPSAPEPPAAPSAPPSSSPALAPAVSGSSGPRGRGGVGSRRTVQFATAGVVAVAVVGLGAALLLGGGDDQTADPATPAPAEERVFDPSTVEVQVLDASGDPVRAQAAANQLAAAGFVASEGARARTQVDQTTVLFRKGDPVSRRGALAVKRGLLPVRSVILEPFEGKTKSLDQGGSVVVLAGPDLIGLP